MSHSFRNSAHLMVLSIAIYSFSVLCNPAMAGVSRDSSVYLREIELMDGALLAETRQTCAMGKMPAIKQKIDTDKANQRFDARFPAVETYCLKVLKVSRDAGHMNDLSINLALQAQGYSDYHSADMSKLLENNEAGRTTVAILSAAKSGATTYTSITGKSHELPCALALDAGMTWAVSSPAANAPVAFSAAEAAEAARQCYAPGVTTITIKGTAMPATKTGLFLGIWLAKH